MMSSREVDANGSGGRSPEAIQVCGQGIEEEESIGASSFPCHRRPPLPKRVIQIPCLSRCIRVRILNRGSSVVRLPKQG